METKGKKSLVNPVALQNCTVRCGDLTAKVLDISFVRLVVDAAEAFSAFDSETFPMELHLDRYHFTAHGSFQGKGENWARLGFERLVPSAGAHLRSFLSPKRIGESIMEDWRNDVIRHYHGLNECELWFDQDGAMLFSYLDNLDPESQFVIRLDDGKAPLRVGKLPRRDYIEIGNIDQELSLIPLSDREIYNKLGECRDVVTNFRPNGQMEYNLKQRLLKVISEHLYSTSRKVEMSHPRPVRTVTTLTVDS